MSLLNNENEIDILAVILILLGMQNLQENRLQSKHNDVQVANNNQAKLLLEDIHRQFDLQNKILEKQTVMLNKILVLLEKRGDSK